MALMMAHEQWVPPPQATPAPLRGDDTSYTSSRSHTNRGRSGPACASPWEAGVVARQRRVREPPRARWGGPAPRGPRGAARRTGVGGHRPAQTCAVAPRSTATQIFDRIAQFNKNMIGQQVV